MLDHAAAVVGDRTDIPFKGNCWAACQADSECNAVSWRADNTGCHLRRVAENQSGTSDSSYQSLRACEPGMIPHYGCLCVIKALVVSNSSYLRQDPSTVCSMLLFVLRARSHVHGIVCEPTQVLLALFYVLNCKSPLRSLCSM